MNLSDIEKKLIMLAMDKAAAEGEIYAAAVKMVESWRKRYQSGVELIKDLQGGAADIGVGVSQAFRRAATASAWNDIMREAKEWGQARATAQAQQRQYTYEEFCRRSAEAAQQAAANMMRKLERCPDCGAFGGHYIHCKRVQTF